MITVPNTDVTVADLAGAVRVVTGASHTTLYYAGDPLPEPVSLPDVPMPVSAAEFRARFTDAEMASILTLAYSGAGDVNAAVLLLKLQTASEIDTGSAEVHAGLAYLTARGVLTPERAGAILSGEDGA